MPAAPSNAQALLFALEEKPELAAYLERPKDLAEILDSDLKQTITAIWGIEAHEKRIEVQNALRENAVILYDKFSDEHPAFGNTAYAAYNAVTELADWRDGNKLRHMSCLAGSRSQEKLRAAAFLETLV